MTPTVEQGLKRLMVARVVMITTLLLIAIYVEAVSETLLRVNPLYFLIAATYALTVVYALALKFLPYRPAQVYVQVVLERQTNFNIIIANPDITLRSVSTTPYEAINTS